MEERLPDRAASTPSRHASELASIDAIVSVDSPTNCVPERRGSMVNPLHTTRRGQRSLRPLLVVSIAFVGMVAAAALMPAAAAKTGGAEAQARLAGNAPKLPGYKLTWKDDFNGAAGKQVEPGKWIYDTGTGYGCAGCPSNWGTFEIESMTDRPQNVSFDGQGNLLITPVRQA